MADLTRPVPLFLLFLLALSLLSYGGLNPKSDFEVLVIGVILPLGLGIFRFLRKPSEKRSKSLVPFWTHWDLKPVHPLGWLFFGIILIGLRFYRWEDVPFWPLMDEGQSAYWSAKLGEHWDWRILYGNFLLEPLFIWILALYFKLFGVSLPAMRLLPIVLSILFLVPGYWAARQYFSRSLSFVLLVLTAFHFWTMACSRQCELVLLLLLWEFLVLGLLGPFCKGKGSWSRAGVLGLTLGIGFYIYAAWPVMVLVVLVALWRGPASSPMNGPRRTFLAGTIALLIGGPLIVQRFSPHGTDYIRHLFDFHMVFRYIEAFFCNGHGSVPYGPAWGGLFNGLLGAFVLVGVVECFKWREEPLVRWLGFAGFLLFLPGALTSHVEMYRVTLLVPILLVLSGFGLQSVIEGLEMASSPKWALTVCFLLGSAVLDCYHYFGPYQDWAHYASIENHWESIELSHAYQKLKERADKGIKLIVLNHLDDFTKDRTFEVAIHPLDYSNSPDFSERSVDEVAVLANVNYKPFLEKWFPQGQWTWLCPDIPDPQGGILLGFIPWNGVNQKRMEHWLKVDRFFSYIVDQTRYMPPNESFGKVLDQLLRYKNEMADDPFLTAQWAAKASYLYTQDYSLDREKIVSALREGIRSVPAAHLYDQLGLLLVSEGDKKGAEASFRRALEAPLNQTSASKDLHRLENLPDNSG